MKNKIKYILAVIGVLIAISGKIYGYTLFLNPLLFILYMFFNVSSLPIMILISGISYFLIGLLFERKGRKEGILYTILILVILSFIAFTLDAFGVGCLC